MQFSDQEHRLAGKLRSAVLAATVGADAIAYTRSAIVTLGHNLRRVLHFCRRPICRRLE